MVEVFAFHAKSGGVFEGVNYAVFAHGRLELAVPNGTAKTWNEDWMDVGPVGSFRLRLAGPSEDH